MHDNCPEVWFGPGFLILTMKQFANSHTIMSIAGMVHIAEPFHRLTSSMPTQLPRPLVEDRFVFQE
jgi:hypothetical protein